MAGVLLVGSQNHQMIWQPSTLAEPTFQSLPLLDWSLLVNQDAVSAVASNYFGTLFNAENNHRISMRISECQVAEVSASQVQAGLAETSDPQNVASARMVVILRSYTGRLELKIERGNRCPIDVWRIQLQRLKEVSASSQGLTIQITTATDQQLNVVWREPVVFAFEAAQVFRDGSSVKLVPIGEREIALRRPDLFKPSSSSSESPSSRKRINWGLGWIASGYYSNLSALNQPWNIESAYFARDALTEYQPTFVEGLAGTEMEPLNVDRIRQFAQRLAQRAAGERCEFFICYYIGHALLNQGRKLALVTGQTTVADLQAALASNDWDQYKTFLPVSELHEWLTTPGTPFLLLVDGCMESKAVQSQIGELGFRFDPKHPSVLFYSGPNEVVSPGDIGALTQLLREVGRVEPFLQSRNPVAFAAKPGTFALARENPLLAAGPLIGPLAHQLYKELLSYPISPGTLPSLKVFLAEILGFRGVGEISLEGGISWSDYTQWDEVTSRLLPGGFVEVGTAANAIRTRIALHLGSIEDFCYDSTTDSWFLQIKSVEPSGRNRWDLWRLPSPISSQPAPPKRIRADIVFPKIAAVGGTLYLYSDDSNTIEKWKVGEKAWTLVLKNQSVSDMTVGADRQSILLIEADSNLDQGGDLIERLTGSRKAKVLEAELTPARCLAESEPNHFFWIDSESSGVVIQCSSTGVIAPITLAREELGGLCATSKETLAISKDRKTLYRWTTDKKAQRASLLDESGRSIVHYDLGWGGLHSFTGNTWLVDGDSLIQIDLGQLAWESLDP
jgi:hypothetical protein